MRCDRAQAALSARMDGQHLPAGLATAVDAHAGTCPRCGAFRDRSARVRAAVRIRPAERIPDLVDPIMAAVARETAAPKTTARRPGAHARPSIRAGWLRRPSLTPVVAAALAGLVVGSVVVGGPWQRGTGPVAVAAIVRGVQGSAATLRSYRATFAIDERGLAPDVPERHLTMDVAYLAPQRFRLDVRDETTYPSPSWTPTDLTFIETDTATYRSGPTGCPADLAPGVCPPTRTTLTSRTGPSAAEPLPGDMVLPLATFDSAEGLRVIGTGSVADHAAVLVELSFARAEPLFPFLRLGGTWRPFFDRDRVDVWLDQEDWAPLRWTVSVAGGADRAAWELRFGRPAEPTGRRILDVRLTSERETPPDPGRFSIPGGAPSPAVPLADLPARVGYRPVTPTDPGDLRLTAALAERPTEPASPRSVLLYSTGLSYVRIAERPDWTGPGLFGPVDTTAQQIRIPGWGVAYYEPAGEGLGRRLAIHAADTNVYLESNLPRERLIVLAASLPVRGEPLPRTWRVQRSAGFEVERVTPGAAIDRTGLDVTLPTGLPPGYVLASAQLERTDDGAVGITFFFRQRETDVAGGPIVLHAEPGTALPPASSAEQLGVDVVGAEGRWTPARGRLEWVRDGLYLSLDGPASLTTMLAVAASAGPATSASSETA